jgi:tRNA A-37 threonylcarbamoyl transferase component Bud32
MYMERIEGITVKQWLREREGNFDCDECHWMAAELGSIIAKIHQV